MRKSFPAPSCIKTKDARNYALRLIKFRLRSEQEVRDRLKKKDYGPQIIEEVVEFLKKTQLVDDALFARLWVESRIKRSLGLARLSYELKAKGIDKGIIGETLGRVKENYDEEEVVRGIIKMKTAKMKDLPVDKIKSRLYGFLLRRGYPRGVVVESLRATIKSNEEEEVV